MLKINDEPTNEFPNFVCKDSAFEVMRTSVLSDMTGDQVAQMTFPLLIRKVPVNLIVSHNRVTHFTRVTCDNYYYVVK